MRSVFVSFTLKRIEAIRTDVIHAIQRVDEVARRHMMTNATRTATLAFGGSYHEAQRIAPLLPLLDPPRRHLIRPGRQRSTRIPHPRDHIVDHRLPFQIPHLQMISPWVISPPRTIRR